MDLFQRDRFPFKKSLPYAGRTFSEPIFPHRTAWRHRRGDSVAGSGKHARKSHPAGGADGVGALEGGPSRRAGDRLDPGELFWISVPVIFVAVSHARQKT